MPRRSVSRFPGWAGSPAGQLKQESSSQCEASWYRRVYSMATTNSFSPGIVHKVRRQVTGSTGVEPRLYTFFKILQSLFNCLACAVPCGTGDGGRKGNQSYRKGSHSHGTSSAPGCHLCEHTVPEFTARHVKAVTCEQTLHIS